ncbi:MAG: tetratricopeptide repeat protein [Alphaproteobacteria bacterium]
MAHANLRRHSNRRSPGRGDNALDSSAPADRRSRDVIRSSALALIAVAGLLAVLPGCASTEHVPAPPPAPQVTLPPDILDKAEGALAGARYAEAQQLFTRILTIEPGNAQARLGLAEVMLAIGNPGQALQLFEQSLDAPDLQPRALQGLGLALLLGDRPQAGFDALKQAVAADPGLWRAWNALGQYHDSHQNWAEANQCYAKALQQNPKSSMVLTNIGASLLMQGRHREAEEKLAKALAIEPGNGVARTNLRMALAWQGRYVDALVGAKGEELISVLNDVGYIALMRHDYGNAEAYLTRALKESPTFFEPAWQNLQYLRSVQGKKAETRG